MATQNPAPPPSGKIPEDRYMPGDPIPAAEAIEADSESVWALFTEKPCEPDPDPEFPETQRAPL